MADNDTEWGLQPANEIKVFERLLRVQSYRFVDIGQKHAGFDKKALTGQGNNNCICACTCVQPLDIQHSEVFLDWAQD